MKDHLLKNLKILYVEDEEEVVQQMEFFLKKRVGRLVVSKNGEEGLKSFKEELPDMVISDLKMPVMDGISMAREIRKTSDVPIIITTAFSDKEIILRAVDVGIEKYIVKPIDARELIKSMENTAVKALRRTGNLLTIRNRAFLKEEKLNIEDKIKNVMVKFIKEKTGRGPKNIKVFIHGNVLEIEIFEVLTKMEKALLKKDKNISIVRYNREIFYRDYEEQIRNIITEFFQWNIKLETQEIDVIKDKNRLKFTIL